MPGGISEGTWFLAFMEESPIDRRLIISNALASSMYLNPSSVDRKSKFPFVKEIYSNIPAEPP